LLLTFTGTSLDSSVLARWLLYDGVIRYIYNCCKGRLQHTERDDMTGKADPTRSIDLRGLYCPEPIFRTAAEIGKIEKGEVLEVVADDPAAEEDIKRWTQRMGQKILYFSKEGNDLKFLIRKTS